MTTPDETHGQDQARAGENPGAPDPGASPTDPGGDPELAKAEEERLRRKLGLSPLEWALSGSFAEQRDRSEPLVIPGFGGEPAEDGGTPGGHGTGEGRRREEGETGGAPPGRQD